jgi:hypothetical protein
VAPTALIMRNRPLAEHAVPAVTLGEPHGPRVDARGASRGPIGAGRM